MANRPTGPTGPTGHAGHAGHAGPARAHRCGVPAVPGVHGGPRIIFNPCPSFQMSCAVLVSIPSAHNHVANVFLQVADESQAIKPKGQQCFTFGRAWEPHSPAPTCMCMYIYIYIIERERDIYIYIYTYIHTYIHVLLGTVGASWRAQTNIVNASRMVLHRRVRKKKKQREVNTVGVNDWHLSHWCVGHPNHPPRHRPLQDISREVGVAPSRSDSKSNLGVSSTPALEFIVCAQRNCLESTPPFLVRPSSDPFHSVLQSHASLLRASDLG